MSMKAIYAYSFLKTVKDEFGANDLRILGQVMAHAVTRIKSADISVDDIVENVAQNWGFSIPIHVVENEIKYLIDQKYLSRVDGQKYQFKRGDVDHSRVLEVEEQTRVKYNRVTDKIGQVITDMGLARRFTSDEVLEQWLDDGSSTPLLNRTWRAFDTLDDTDIHKIIGRAMGLPDQADSQLIDDLADIAYGDAIYKAMQFATESDSVIDPETPDRKPMSDVEVYLDIRPVSAALGYLSDIEMDASLELLKLASQTGCRLRMFHHNFEELQGSITRARIAIERGIPPNRSGLAKVTNPMVDHAIRHGLTPSKLIELHSDLHSYIVKLGIEIVHRDDIDFAKVDFHPDELKLDGMIKNAFEKGPNAVDLPELRKADVDSLVSVFRLRGNAPKDRLERSNAIFITSNRTLQSVSHRFFKSHFDEMGQKNIVQICMTDAVFATRMWTKLPTVFGSRPRAQIISNVMANIFPQKAVRERFTAHLDDLHDQGKISDAQYVMTRYSTFKDILLSMELDSEPTVEQSASIVARVIANRSEDLKAAILKGYEAARTEAEAIAEAAEEATPIPTPADQHDLEQFNLTVRKIVNEAKNSEKYSRIMDKVNSFALITVGSIIFYMINRLTESNLQPLAIIAAIVATSLGGYGLYKEFFRAPPKDQ